MDESELESNGSWWSKVCVKGYPTGIRGYDLTLALTKHFASCGEVRSVCIRRDFKRGILKRRAFINIWGEGAEEKALELNGSDVGGWAVIVSKDQPSPDEEDYFDPGWATVKDPQRQMIVTGYDTSLPEMDIMIGLSRYFSSCGDIMRITVPGDGCGGINSEAIISIVGEDALEKAQALSGSEVQGWKIDVFPVMPPPPATVRKRFGYSLPKKARMRLV